MFFLNLSSSQHKLSAGGKLLVETLYAKIRFQLKPKALNFLFNTTSLPNAVWPDWAFLKILRLKIVKKEAQILGGFFGKKSFKETLLWLLFGQLWGEIGLIISWHLVTLNASYFLQQVCRSRIKTFSSISFASFWSEGLCKNKF